MPQSPLPALTFATQCVGERRRSTAAPAVDMPSHSATRGTSPLSIQDVSNQCLCAGRCHQVTPQPTHVSPAAAGLSVIAMCPPKAAAGCSTAPTEQVLLKPMPTSTAVDAHRHRHSACGVRAHTYTFTPHTRAHAHTSQPSLRVPHDSTPFCAKHTRQKARHSSCAAPQALLPSRHGQRVFKEPARRPNSPLSPPKTEVCCVKHENARHHTHTTVGAASCQRHSTSWRRPAPGLLSSCCITAPDLTAVRPCRPCLRPPCTTPQGQSAAAPGRPPLPCVTRARHLCPPRHQCHEHVYTAAAATAAS